MRIAFLCGDTGIAVSGEKGAAVHVRDLATAFERAGHAVTVVAARLGPCGDRLPWPSIEVPSRASGRTLSTREAEWLACTSNAATRAVLDRLHARWPIDLVYERYSLWQHAGVGFARHAGVPHVLEVNSPLRLEQARYRTLHLSDRAARVERFVLAGTTRVVAVSAEVAAHVALHGAAGGRVRVVPNGTDLEPFRHLARRPANGRFTVGFLGSLKPWHGVDVLLDAAERLAPALPGLEVLVVGDGPERASLERRAYAPALAGRVTFTGAVPKADVPSWLARMHVATAPYPRLQDFYFSPLKLYDYMAAGCAIVASRIGQISSVVTHGVNALLASPGDADHLATHLRTLHDHPWLASALGARARATAFACHGWEHRVASILEHLPLPSAAAGARDRAVPCEAR